MKVLLQSDLTFMSLPDLLQWIDMNRKDCVVTVVQGEKEFSFYLEGGKTIYASAKKSPYRLGEFLVRHGDLSQDVVAKGLKESREAGITFTRYLIDRELMTVKDLTIAFSMLVEGMFMDIFSSGNGKVLVAAPIPNAVLNGPVRLETSQILFDSVRKMDELNRDRLQKDEADRRMAKILGSDDYELPVLPTIISQLTSLINDEGATFQDMARLIMSDQVLVSRILRIANSPLYASFGQIDSIHFAIARLGMKEITNIVTAIKLGAMEVKGIAPDRLQAILDDALKSAFITSGLARIVRVDPEEAFMAGLLHDLGKTVMISLGTELKLSRGLLEELVTERHAEVGCQLVKSWNYPDSIQNLIRYHHNFHVGGVFNRMIALVQVADTVVATGSGVSIEPEVLDRLDIDIKTINDTYRKALDAFEQIKAMK